MPLKNSNANSLPNNSYTKNFSMPSNNHSPSVIIGKKKGVISGRMDPATGRITTHVLFTSLMRLLRLSRICFSDLKLIQTLSSTLVTIWSKTCLSWSHLPMLISMNCPNHSLSCACSYSKTHSLTSLIRKTSFNHFPMTLSLDACSSILPKTGSKSRKTSAVILLWTFLSSLTNTKIFLLNACTMIKTTNFCSNKQSRKYLIWLQHKLVFTTVGILYRINSEIKTMRTIKDQIFKVLHNMSTLTKKGFS